MQVAYLLYLPLDPEDGGDAFLPKRRYPNYTELQPRRPVLFTVTAGETSATFMASGAKENTRCRKHVK
jgi:hypothetical protein